MARDDRPTLPRGAFSAGRAGLDSYETVPPPLDAVLWLMLSHAEVTALAVDPREQRLLSLIDGRANVATLIELAEMPATDVRRLLARWLAAGIVKLGETRATRGR